MTDLLTDADRPTVVDSKPVDWLMVILFL